MLPPIPQLPLVERAAMDTATFCRTYPFHFVLNSQLQIVQVGNSLLKIIDFPTDIAFVEIFEIIRPPLDVTFDNIIQDNESVFVIKVRDSVNIYNQHYVNNPEASKSKKSKLRLKGGFFKADDKLLFIGSPMVTNLDELEESGLFISDIASHDSTRDLLLLSEKARAESELSQQLEDMTDKLQDTYKELEKEKELNDKLMYSILPPSVADKLRNDEPVEAVKYKSVSILFSGIYDFNSFLTTNPPIKVVNLLNELYTKFDALAEPSTHNVYKVETVGDKYMLAGGLPGKSCTHARSIARVALNMLDISNHVHIGEQTVQIKIGIHSGDVVAGVVGQKLAHYAVFGNTVCLASRMESTGKPGKINISENTYACLSEPQCYDPQFCFESRGLINIKGRKKPMECFFITRRVVEQGRERGMSDESMSELDPDDYLIEKAEKTTRALNDTTETLTQVAANLQRVVDCETRLETVC